MAPASAGAFLLFKQSGDPPGNKFPEIKSPAFFRGALGWERSQLHSWITAVIATGRSFLVFRNIGDQSFGGQHERSDGSRVLQGGTGYLGWIDDAGFHQVFELIVLG